MKKAKLVTVNQSLPHNKIIGSKRVKYLQKFPKRCTPNFPSKVQIYKRYVDLQVSGVSRWKNATIFPSPKIMHEYLTYTYNLLS